jgi:hypothetical protein
MWTEDQIEWVWRHTLPLLGLNPVKDKEGIEELELVGGAVLLKHESKPYMITAAHVVDFITAQNYRSLFFFGSAGNPVSISNESVHGSTVKTSHRSIAGRIFDPVDIGIFRLTEEAAGTITEKDWLKGEDIEKNVRAADRSKSVLLGGVGCLSRTVENDGTNARFHTGIGIIEACQDNDGFHIDGHDRRVHHRLLVRMGKGDLSRRDYVGLSGSGFWSIPSSPGEMPKLRGIMTRVHQKQEMAALLGCQARYIHQFLKGEAA